MPVYEIRILDVCGDLVWGFQMFLAAVEIGGGSGGGGARTKVYMVPQFTSYQKELLQLIQTSLFPYPMSVGPCSWTPNIYSEAPFWVVLGSIQLENYYPVG